MQCLDDSECRANAALPPARKASMLVNMSKFLGAKHDDGKAVAGHSLPFEHYRDRESISIDAAELFAERLQIE
jgi:hypothetical protein